MIKKSGSKFLVKDSSGKKTLGSHATRKEALAQLRAIEASKASSHSYADGGLSDEAIEALKERFSKVEPTQKKMFSGQEAEAAKKAGASIAETYPELKDVVRSIAERKLGTKASNLDVDLADINATIPGTRPMPEASSLVKGTPELLSEDLSKVTGSPSQKDVSSIVKSTPTAPTGKMEFYKTGAEWTADRMAKRARQQALNALKLGSKKAMAAIPVVGGLGAALASGDAAAAIPIPGLDSEELGPRAGTPEGKLERGEPLSEEDRRILERRMALQKLRSGE